MQIIALLLEILLLISCQNKPVEKNTNNLKKNSNDQLRLIKLLDFSDPRSSSLVLKNDTVFIINSSNFKNTIEHSIRNFFYDSLNKKFQFNYNVEENNLRAINNVVSFSDTFHIYLQSIGHPKISYSNLPEVLKNKNELKKIVTRQTKIQLFNGSFYFMDKTFPTALDVYNPTTDKLDSFNLKYNFFEVTDFFLHDLDRDGNPEIFIFNIGRIPREDMISYSIYSIRKDSVKVDYK